MESNIYSNFFKEYLDLFPSVGSYLGYREYDNRFENSLSKSHSNEWKRLLIKYKELMEKQDSCDLHAQSFKWYIEDELKQFNNLRLMPISSFENVIISMVFFNKRFYPRSTHEDVHNLVIRFESMIKMMNTCVSCMKEGIRKRVVIPKCICKHVIKDLKLFLKSKGYVIPVEQSLMTKKYEKVLDHYMNTLKNLIEFIEKIYYPECRESIGLSDLPSGKQNYETIIKGEMTLNYNPVEVYEFGILEVKRIMEEFHKLKTLLGYKDLTYKEFCKKIMLDPKNYASSKEELMKVYKEQQHRIHRSVIRNNFHTSLKKTYKIESIPKELEGSSVAAFYYAGNYKDGDGTFYVNTKEMKNNPLYETFVLSLHEGEPGHHYQFQYMIEKNIPQYFVFSFISNGFVEGWALYCENLGKYSLLETFGKLSFEMLRAVRLVVDVGIHYYKWDYRKALNYMMKHIPMERVELEAELLRYICLPGQAVSYKIGERFFIQLKETYLKKNSTRTIKDYHEAVLKNGIIPLEILKNEFATKYRTIL